MRTMLPKFGTNLVRESSISYHFHECNISRFRSCHKKLASYSAYSTVELPNSDITSSCSEDHNWQKKIKYNDIFHLEKKNERNRIRNEKIIYQKSFYTPTALTRVKPLFLECMTDSDGKQEMKITENSSTDSVVQFPYEFKKNVLVDSNIPEETLEVARSYDDPEQSVEFDTQLKRIKKGELEFKSSKQWEGEGEREVVYSDGRFGTSDPNIPVSNVPCGGCGALLHCQDMAIPGFLPKEIFHDLKEADLRGITCQRCVFLQEYNIALGINVNPDEYPKILSQIKNQNALVILMVDLLDFPCSIWPNIMDVIGKNKPLFVVGNKMDLLIQENQFNYIKHRIQCLKDALEDIGINPAMIKYVSLISAKTGYGVENLITNLQNLWGTKGDIYIAGCTNAGKSTLFNTLIQSDFCKVQATDILQRATVSEWPGTTLNLLKFPVLKPLSWRKVIRSQRLKFTEKQMEALRKLQTSVLRSKDKEHQLSLMGYIGRSFGKEESSGLVGLDPNDPNFKLSKWCYDTPGVVHQSQILNLFTTEELAKVLPRTTIVPRNFKLIPGNSLFIGGVARLDLISSNTFVWFTVFASAELPVTVTNVEDADFVYKKLLGTNLFAVPCGSKERLEKWPKLLSKNITVVGTFQDVAAADVVLSSAGWIAITLDPARSCKLCAWTPDRRGIFVREPSLIKYSSLYKSNKIRGTPAYYPSLEIVEDVEVVS